MNFDRPSEIPEDNQLPLRIKGAEVFESPGRETKVYKADIETASNDTETVILKEVRGGEFEKVEETIEEAEQSKAFYDFLKSSPKFSEFVPETLHFVARVKEGEAPRSYRLQRRIEGRTLDEIPDEELYANPKLEEELFRCVDGLVDVFEKQQKEGGDLPDLYGRKALPNLLFDPRETTNLMVADAPDEEGRRIFFVDTSKQSQGKSSKAIDWYQKNVGGPAQLMHLKRWRRTLERKLALESERAVPEGIGDPEGA